MILELAVKWWRCGYSWVVRSARPWWCCLYRLGSMKESCWIWRESQTGVAIHSFTHTDAISQNYEYLSNQKSLTFYFLPFLHSEILMHGLHHSIKTNPCYQNI
jgi:hypothetical protein